MSIYVITGKTGHGKTAFMVKWARDAIKAGARVYSNVKLNLGEMSVLPRGAKPEEYEGKIWKKEDREDKKKRVLYWENFSDWDWFRDGIAFIDEGLVYFNARRWEQLSDDMQMRFVQHRKDKVDLVFNVQHYTFIEKTLRILAERFVNVRLEFGSPRFKKSWIPRISKIHEYDIATLNRCENLGIDPYDVTKELAEKYNIEPKATEWFWIRNKVMRWYDTSVKVGESRPENLKHIERKCETCGHVQTRHA